MTPPKFWTLLAFSLIIATLIASEIVAENKVSNLNIQVNYYQGQINLAQRQNEMLHQLVQRIAVASQGDAALMNLLNKRGIHISSAPRAVDMSKSTPISSPVTPSTSATP